MKPIDLMAWKKRAALVYAMGVWTAVGMIMHATRPEWFSFKTGLDPNEEVPDHLEKEIYQSGNWSTVIYRKKDQVPYHTRFSNYIKSLGGGNETKDDEE